MDKSTLNILTKIKINKLEYYLRTNIFSIGFILQLILLFIQMVFAILIPDETAFIFILLAFPILICCTALIVKYKGQKIEEELEFFEDDMEFYITGRVKYKLFEKIIKNLDRKKYHICREIDANGYIEDWSIFRKDMSIDEYFSAENKPLLSSEKNNILDLKNFVKEQKNEI